MNIRIDESDLLAYIEGALPPSELARVESALAQDAGLRAAAHAMRQDRVMLRELGATVAAPPGLVDAAIARAEREYLLGAEVTSPALGSASPSFWRRTPARVALAAGLALAATAAVLAPSYFNRKSPVPTGVALAPAPGHEPSSEAADASSDSKLAQAPVEPAGDPALAQSKTEIALAPKPNEGDVRTPGLIAGPTPVSIDASKGVDATAARTAEEAARAAEQASARVVEIVITADKPARVAGALEELAVSASADLVYVTGEGAESRSVLTTGMPRWWGGGAPASMRFELIGAQPTEAWLEHAREWIAGAPGVRSSTLTPAQPGARSVDRVIILIQPAPALSR